MEQKYILLTADIEEVKALLSKHNVAYQTDYASAKKLEDILIKGEDPNNRVAYITFSEYVK